MHEAGSKHGVAASSGSVDLWCLFAMVAQVLNFVLTTQFS